MSPSMTGNLPSVQVRQARTAISVNFLCYGVAVASWAPMVPYVKARLGLDDATLGFVLLAMGAGGLLTLPVSGMLAQRVGTRTMTWVGAPCVCATLPLLALANGPWLLAMALFAFSGALGAMSIGMNAQAIEVNKLGRKPVLSRIHGVYSVGALSGSALMSLCLAAGVPLVVCAASIALCLAVMALSQRRRLLPSEHSVARSGARRLQLPPRAVVLLGVLCAILFMGEGAMLDWSAVFLHDVRGIDAATAGLGFTAYAVAMALSRFVGDAFTHRFGSISALRAGTLVGVAGLLCAIVVPSALAAFVGFALVGFGLANTVPIVFAASGRVSPLPPAAALPLVTALGYSGLLAGPALIGVVAKAVGLPVALGSLALLLVCVAIKASAIQPAR